MTWRLPTHLKFAPQRVYTSVMMPSTHYDNSRLNLTSFVSAMCMSISPLIDIIIAHTTESIYRVYTMRDVSNIV